MPLKLVAYITVWLCIDTRCISPPMVANATVTFDVNARSILIECFVGYRISFGAQQGYVSATVHCSADSTWPTTVNSCTRTSHCSAVKDLSRVNLAMRQQDGTIQLFVAVRVVNLPEI